MKSLNYLLTSRLEIVLEIEIVLGSDTSVISYVICCSD